MHMFVVILLSTDILRFSLHIDANNEHYDNPNVDKNKLKIILTTKAKRKKFLRV